MRVIKEKVLKKNTYVYIKTEDEMIEIVSIIRNKNRWAKPVEYLKEVSIGIKYPCYISISKKYEWEYHEEYEVEADSIFGDIKLIKYKNAFKAECNNIEAGFDTIIL